MTFDLVTLKSDSLRYFKLDVNYKECHNSIVGILLLSLNTITLFKNSILIQAQINVKCNFLSIPMFNHHQIMRFELNLYYVYLSYFRFYLNVFMFNLDFIYFINHKT